MTEFVNRNCPACESVERRAEMASEQRAEALSFDQLSPYWSGLFKDKLFFTYQRCSDCGLLYAPVFFKDEQLTQLYSAMAPNMDVVPTAAIEATQHSYFVEAMRDLKVGGDYLELGPDVGHFVRLAAATAAFDRFWLVEPNLAVHDELARTVPDRPHTILSTMADLSAVPDGTVALAVMIHVLDHLTDPRAMLEQVRTKLKRGGRLAIVTHNERSVLRSLMGRRWPPFCLQHPELYNPRSIKQLLERSGYDKVRVRRSKSYFPLGFMARQAAYSIGLKLDRLALPQGIVGLRLGNIITLAHWLG